MSGESGSSDKPKKKRMGNKTAFGLGLGLGGFLGVTGTLVTQEILAQQEEAEASKSGALKVAGAKG